MVRKTVARFAVCVAASVSIAAHSPAQTAAHHGPYYLPSSTVNFIAILPGPPKPGSAPAKVDLASVHLAEHDRTSSDIAQARADDAQEDIFIYASVLGPHFNAREMPLTAAFSQHLRNDVGVVNPPLKARYNRPRPFLADPTLHAVCEKKTEGSYPSGHAAVGYLTGLVLAQMLPERAGEILARADSYAHNRIVCGVHYPTDIEASKMLALVMLGQIATSAQFQNDVLASKGELRTILK